jgi:hypothetical protein
MSCRPMIGGRLREGLPEETGHRLYRDGGALTP